VRLLSLFPKQQLILVNGAWPGPTIRANFGDRLIIAVDNQLDVPVSVHSHGIIQREEATMDGLVGVTQRCAL
jgi:FtsP/CotA-like multicopper oxidase with cupredoxin domain